MRKSSIKINKNIPCELSDGTILRADVYRPNDEKTYPVLMIRLPYDKETPRYYDEYLEVPRMVHAGYVVILQDVRGRFASEGEFYPFIDEGKDGYEAVEWAAKLPYSNGKVGMFGMSYHGYTQLAAAAETPPSLKAIAPVMTGADLAGNFIGREGEPHAVANFQTWVLGSMMEDHLKRKGNFNKEKFDYYVENITEWLSCPPANEWVPIKDLDPDSYYFDFMKDNLSKAFKERTNLIGKLDKVEVPALFMGGWFDGLLAATLEAYQAYKGTKMLWIGPWTHEEMTGRCGERLFRNAAEDIGVDKLKDPTEIHIKWFDKWLKGKPLPMEKYVHLYLMNQDLWKAFDEWPINEDVKVSELYLRHSEIDKEGELTRHPAKVQTKKSLTLDPNNPVPTIGGGTLIAGHESGVFDVSHIQEREDVLIFTSMELSQDLHLLGSSQASIWVSSPSNLLDISLRLSDVDAHGHAYNIVDTFHREKVEKINQAFYLEIELGSTAYTLRKGHRLRLDIAASNAPLYDVNLNNGTTTKTHSRGQAAVEYIYHGGEKASKLFIPVVDKA